jgi:hypothetical protein
VNCSSSVAALSTVPMLFPSQNSSRVN